MLDPKLKQAVVEAQKAEITEHVIYRRLAERISDEKNSGLLKQIAQDELAHYHFYQKLSGQDVSPNYLKVFIFVSMSRLFGLSFALKLLEKDEDLAQEQYQALKAIDPHVQTIIEDEEKHEQELLNMIDEERMQYMGSVVLGLNDALVELTGALAGFTLALQNTKLIAASGLIIGVAASLSMAASEYLSTKEEGEGRHPLKACVYTGIAYVGVVVLLISPYFVLNNPFICLAWALVAAISVIAFFNYYISVAKDLNFRKHFMEMLVISLGVATLNFFVGLAAKQWLNLEV